VRQHLLDKGVDKVESSEDGAITSETGITIRQCTSLADFAACIELQRTVWQFTDLDIIPLRSFVITMHSGGMTHGAFDEAGHLLGFSHALAAFDEALRPYYYSHMLAVEPGWRDAGIGWKLKMAQREHALRSGVGLIRWTYDPLQSRNAHLNLNKLGGVVRQYKVNYYGNTSTSALHRGLDTDRLFVEWWVRSSRVARAIAKETGSERRVAGVVEIPRDIEKLKSEEMVTAQETQLKVRAEFLEHFTKGLYCAGFEAKAGEPSRYLFFTDDHVEETESAIF
jgi:predicted GNAT superfamily acetyltransferase